MESNPYQSNMQIVISIHVYMCAEARVTWVQEGKFFFFFAEVFFVCLSNLIFSFQNQKTEDRPVF